LYQGGVAIKNKRTVKALAIFWRYGYLILAYIIFNNNIVALAVSTLIFGLYTILISLFCTEHFICGMQDVFHKKMTPFKIHQNSWLKGARRDGILIGILFCVFSIYMLLRHI